MRRIGMIQYTRLTDVQKYYSQEKLIDDRTFFRVCLFRGITLIKIKLVIYAICNKLAPFFLGMLSWWALHPADLTYVALGLMGKHQ
jgi:hypothetical protein